MAEMSEKRSLEVTKGATMIEPTSLIETTRVQSSDPEKPYPTDEEFATLVKVPGSIPWTAWTVAVVEFAERFSYYGTTAVCTCRSAPRTPCATQPSLTRPPFPPSLVRRMDHG